MEWPAPGSDYEIAEPGLHLAGCIKVIDLGTQPTGFGPKRKLYVEWELPTQTLEDGRPMTVGASYNLSTSKKSTLRKHLESWRGVPFEERHFGNGPEAFKPETLLGKWCLLNVVHNHGVGDKADRTYANVDFISKVPPNQRDTLPKAMVNEPLTLDLRTGHYNSVVFGKLPEWLQKKIASSSEYQRVVHGIAPEQGQPRSRAPVGEVDQMSDEIPF